MSAAKEPTLGDILDDIKKQLAEIWAPIFEPNINTIINIPERSTEPMTEKEYNEIPAVRRSDLLKLRRSPLHYKWAAEHPEEQTPAQAFGAAGHKFILEGAEAFVAEYAVTPNFDKRTKAGKEAFAEWIEQNQGKTPISIDDYQQILEMHQALQQHAEARELLKGQHEQTYTWTDTETGEECKIRLDCLTTTEDGRPTIIDYKTVSSCEPGVFERECRSYGYKIQAGMYTEGLAIATNFLVDAGFAFVCQEKKPPYAVRVYRVDPSFVEQGNRQFHELLRYFHECKITDNWPGYADGYLLADEWEEVAE